jgi:parvulin-like peptidyl-prolyl isomerase
VKATIVKAKRNRNIQNINPKNFWPGTRLTLTLLFGGMLLCAEAIAANPVAQGSAPKAASAFATVGNVVITWQDYRNAYASEASNKFYHAKPNNDALAVFQRQVGDKLVANALLVQEAKRRNLKPDNAAVDQELQTYEQRFAKDPKWPEARKRVLPTITKKLQDENIRNKLEKLVRNVPPPTKQQLREYYDAHSDKFTSPPQPRVSVILIKVDPSSTEEEWHKAMEEGEGLVKRIRAGEDFAALARDYSGDVTAEEGGDMGYLHTGMLPGLPEETVSKLQPGDTSNPVKLLEGVAIFRLIDRIQPAASSFETSQQRVSELWLSEQRDIAWNSLIAKLRKKTRVHVDESRFLPLTVAATKKPAENDGAALPATK